MMVILALLFGGAFWLVCFENEDVTASNDPIQPPEGGTVIVNGLWEVTDAKEYHNCTIVMNGNLTIKNGGTLTFRNVTLIMNNTKNGTFNIEVWSGGEFNIYDTDNSSITDFDISNITSTDPDYHYMFWVKKGANFTMRNSELHGCGWSYHHDEHNGLLIETDNAIIVGNIISNNHLGIQICESSGFIIKNNEIFNNIEGGILLRRSNNITIHNNTIYDNVRDGIYLWGSSDIIISENIIYNNNLYKDVGDDTGGGIKIGSSCTVTIINNIIFNNIRQGIYIGNSSGINITNNTIYTNTHFGVKLYLSSNCSILNNNICGHREFWFASGIYTSDLSNTTISNNMIFNNTEGIHLYSGSNNIMSGDELTDNNIGIFITAGSSYNQILGVQINNCSSSAIEIGHSSNNLIDDCNISFNSQHGIYITDSECNIITSCRITNNTKGIYLNSCFNNTLFYNFFINNSQNAYDDGNNSWDDGSMGNYWDDHSNHDTDIDEIADNPYAIPGGNNLDHYPLITSKTPPMVEIIDPAGVQSGNITVTYILTDLQSNYCSIIVEYSIDGINFSIATRGAGGDGVENLSTSPDGITHNFLWVSIIDLGEQNISTVFIKITPYDLDMGMPQTTSAFQVNNLMVDDTEDKTKSTSDFQDYFLWLFLIIVIFIVLLVFLLFSKFKKKPEISGEETESKKGKNNVRERKRIREQ